MNIGIFTDTYYPTINGVSTSTRMLQKELSRLGHKVYIFTVSDPEAQKGVPRVFRLPSMPLMFLPTHRVCLLYPPKLILKIKSLKLDIVHTQTEFPLGIFGHIVADFYKLPVVHTYHTMYEDYVHYIANGHLITPKLAQKFSKIFCNKADVVISPVEKTKAKLLEYGVKKPIRVLPSGIDFAPFSRSKYTEDDINGLKKELNIGLDCPVVVSIGRVAKEKSIDVTIHQFSKVLLRFPDAKLVIVGNGPILEELRELSNQLGIEKSVIFTGAVLWDNIGKYYQLGDVFITASVTETQGLTHIEAMAALVPVVAKRDSSFESVITDGETGFFFEHNEQAADVICHVIENRQEASQVAKNAFAKIQHLSAENFAKQMSEVYDAALAEKPPKKRLKLGFSDIDVKSIKLKKFIIKGKGRKEL